MSSNQELNVRQGYIEDSLGLRRELNEMIERLRLGRRQIRDEIRDSIDYSSSFSEVSDHYNRRDRNMNDPNNNSQRFREAYQFTTLEECKVED